MEREGRKSRVDINIESISGIVGALEYSLGPINVAASGRGPMATNDASVVDCDPMDAGFCKVAHRYITTTTSTNPVTYLVSRRRKENTHIPSASTRWTRSGIKPGSYYYLILHSEHGIHDMTSHSESESANISSAFGRGLRTGR